MMNARKTTHLALLWLWIREASIDIVCLDFAVYQTHFHHDDVFYQNRFPAKRYFSVDSTESQCVARICQRRRGREYHGERVECEPITGFAGGAGSRGRALGQGSGSKAP